MVNMVVGGAYARTTSTRGVNHVPLSIAVSVFSCCVAGLGH